MLYSMVGSPRRAERGLRVAHPAALVACRRAVALCSSGAIRPLQVHPTVISDAFGRAAEKAVEVRLCACAAWAVHRFWAMGVGLRPINVLRTCRLRKQTASSVHALLLRVLLAGQHCCCAAAGSSDCDCLLTRWTRPPAVPPQVLTDSIILVSFSVRQPGLICP